MLYDDIKLRRKRAYNSSLMQGIIKSQIDSLDLDTFMVSKDTSDPETALSALI